MGAGKKVAHQNNPFHLLTYNSNPHSARNLRKKDLAGVIFGCTHSTFKECISNQLFGLPASHIQYVQNITPGMPLFLFNYSDRTLHGIFEATTAGQMYINRHAWTFDDHDSTPYPAQVRVKIQKKCKALCEDKYKVILAKNYLEHEPNHLWFELDQAQTQKLISLFSTFRVSPSVSLSSTAAKVGPLFRRLAAPVIHQEDRGSRATSVNINQELLCNSSRTLKGEEKSNVLLGEDVAADQENVTTVDSGKKWSSLFIPPSNSSPPKECEDLTSEGNSTMSVDEPSMCSESTPDHRTTLVISEMIDVAETLTAVSEATFSAKKMSSEVNSILRAVVNKLTEGMGELKELHSKQNQKIQKLELELEEANNKLQKFKVHHQKSGPLGSSLLAEERQLEKQDVYQSILIVGGFDGSSWLQNLDCYCPLEDATRPLTRMNSVRSYTSAVELDKKLYVLGGGYGSCWYDTVEAYDLKGHQWVTCPSLNRKKGSLAATSLGSKIFAIGGGNAADCFSDVEVLDIDVGKWITTRSMMQERFAPAATEFNGAIYVTGGYDGHNYVSSLERFDPRESSWKRLQSMNSRRGCHSLTVLNEKLYAIGGYDGTKMVPTVEVFEPRTGSWTMSKHMTSARGYMGSVNFGEKIYVMGGMQENNDILDTVECYSEDEGWKLAQLKTMGKRCFLSAVTV